MEEDRRTFLKQSVRYVLLTGAATVAWEHILAGAPEQAPNYQTTDHWWGMTIDVDKCIGSGNCVRACKDENDVPLEDGYFRTWVERYRVDPDDPEHPLVDSPNGGYDGFPEIENPGGRMQDVLRAQDVQPLRGLAVHAGLPGGGDVRQRRTAWCSIDKDRCVGCRYCVQACPYGCRFIDPRTHTADKCTLCYHRITKGLTTACAEVCPTGARQLVDFKNPEGSRCTSSSARTRFTCSSRSWPRAPRFTTTAWMARFAEGDDMPGVDGFIYPNEIELQWSVLIVALSVPDGTRGRRVHPGLARARVQRGRGAAHLPPRPSDRAGVPDRRAAAAADAPRASRALVRDVHHAAHRRRPWRCSASSTSGI